MVLAKLLQFLFIDGYALAFPVLEANVVTEIPT